MQQEDRLKYVAVLLTCSTLKCPASRPLLEWLSENGAALSHVPKKQKNKVFILVSSLILIVKSIFDSPFPPHLKIKHLLETPSHNLVLKREQ